MADNELEVGMDGGGGDGGEQAVTPPPASPNFDDGFDVLDRRTDAGADADTGRPSTAQTPASADPAQQPGQPEQPPQPPPAAPAFPPDLEAQMRRAGLRPNPGEAPETARTRLFDTMHGWNARLRIEAERATQAYNAQAAAVAELREQLAPVIRAHWEQEQARQTAALAEQIPEPGTPEYALWLQEENLHETEQLREELRQKEANDAAAAQERQIREEEARVDGIGLDIVSCALGQVEGAEADPEFQNAYTSLTRVALTALRQRFPNMSEEKIRGFVAETQLRETREFLIAGLDPVQEIKGRYRAYRDAFVVAHGGENGNGHQQQPSAQPAVPVAPAPQQPAPTSASAPIGSPNARAIQAEAAAAARRGPVAAPVTSRPVGAANGLPLDALDYESSDDYVEAVLAGLVTEAQRMAPPRRRQRPE